MNDTSVTVIVPMYNAGKTIGRCLASVAPQGPREILLIDDGSADGTAQTAASLNLPNTRIIRADHAGASAARNRGIREAKGDWILFLDADDALTPDAVQSLTETLTGETDACCGAILRGQETRPETAHEPGAVSDSHALLNYVLADPTNRLTIHGWIFRRSVLTENNLFFNPELTLGEDSDFVLRVLSHTREVRFMNKPVYRYTLSPASTVNRWKPGVADRYLKTIRALEGTDASQEKNWPLFVLTTLLLILTHDTFHPANPESGKEQLRSCQRLREIPVFDAALKSADLSPLGAGRKITLLCLKAGLYPLVRTAVRIRQRQNASRTGE